MEINSITREDLKQKIDNGESLIIIDTLGESSYSSIHLPGAKSINGHGDDVVEQVEEIVPDKNAEVAVYCTSFACQLSPSVTKKLMEAGYTNVKDFEGGLKDWAEAGYPFEGDAVEQRKEDLLN